MFELRTATAADGLEIWEVFLASRADALPYLPKVHTDADTLHWIIHELIPSRKVWVASAEGRIVGFLALNGEEIEHLYIAPAFYRRGAGSLLLSQACAVSRRLHLFTFERNTRARAFYEAHGFAAAEFNDGSRNEEHEPDVKYIWTADP